MTPIGSPAPTAIRACSDTDRCATEPTKSPHTTSKPMHTERAGEWVPLPSRLGPLILMYLIGAAAAMVVVVML